MQQHTTDTAYKDNDDRGLQSLAQKYRFQNIITEGNGYHIHRKDNRPSGIQGGKGNNDGWEQDQEHRNLDNGENQDQKCKDPCRRNRSQLQANECQYGLDQGHQKNSLYYTSNGIPGNCQDILPLVSSHFFEECSGGISPLIRIVDEYHGN